MTLSLLLDNLGLSSTVHELLPRISAHPKAHFISLRSMEIFSEAGVA